MLFQEALILQIENICNEKTPQVVVNFRVTLNVEKPLQGQFL